MRDHGRGHRHDNARCRLLLRGAQIERKHTRFLAQRLGFKSSQQREEAIELAAIRVLAGGEHAFDDGARQAHSMGAVARQTDLPLRFDGGAEGGKQAAGKSGAIYSAANPALRKSRIRPATRRTGIPANSQRAASNNVV
jgi:hypothetical protein